MFELSFIWAGIIAFAVLTYVILDGFDLGVGILFPLAEGAVFSAAGTVSAGVVDDAAVASGDEALSNGEQVLFEAATAVKEDNGSGTVLRNCDSVAFESFFHASRFLSST